ncbi:MAG: hypothetical protein N2202_06130 [Proteobacteria bacterium]|nr:hypothetical protein [Pseudomonadota bacterium]
MGKNKTCKKCGESIIKEEHKIKNYNIIIARCKCNWKLIDVLDESGSSLKDFIGRDVLEKMLRSKVSNINL